MAGSFGRFLRVTFAYFVGVYTGNWWYLASTLSGERDRVRADKANRRARQQYNDSLKDRLEMLDVVPSAARSIVLGRVRYVEGVRRRWTSGTNAEKLTMIVSFAGHEIDAYEQWYLDDIPVTLDGSGYVQEAPFFQGRRDVLYASATLDGSGGAVINLGVTPVSGTVIAVWATGSGDNMFQGAASVSMAGTVATISGGQPGATVTVTYSVDTGTYHVRIREYLGTATQNVGADIAAEYPGKITSSDKFAGMACIVMDVLYNPDVFPQGRPTPTAVMRGAKVYDPTKDSTNGGSGAHRLATPSTWEWSESPPLHGTYYAMHPNGGALTTDEIRWADVRAAVPQCATSTVFTLRMPDTSTTTATLPRFRCGIVISTAAEPRQGLADIAETMAGRIAFSGGQLRMRAGVLNSTAASIDQTWLYAETDASGAADTDPVVSGVQSITRSQRINRVTGSCVDPDQRYQMLPFPAVEDSTLIAAKGERLAEVEFAGVNHIAHAQHLASIAIREAQAGSRYELKCGYEALKAELLDVVELTLPRQSISAKTCEIVGWRWAPDSTIRVQLSEITAALYTVASELDGRDPAPDSGIRKPWDVEALTLNAVSSGTTAVLDGSILTRTVVEWDAAVGENIRNGGQIEVQYTEATGALPAGDWPSWIEAGSAVQAVIPGLLSGHNYLFRVRAVQTLPLVRGAWSDVLVEQIAKPRPSSETVHAEGGTFVVSPHNSSATFTADIVTASYTNVIGRTITVRIDASCSELFNYVEGLLTTRLVKVNIAGAVADNGDFVLKDPIANPGLGNDVGTSKFYERSLASGGTITVKVQRQSAVAGGSVPTVAEVNGYAAITLTAYLR